MNTECLIKLIRWLYTKNLQKNWQLFDSSTFNLITGYYYRLKSIKLFVAFFQGVFKITLICLTFVFSQTRNANLAGQRELAMSSSKVAFILNNVALGLGLTMLTVLSIGLYITYRHHWYCDTKSLILWKKWQIFSRPSEGII